MWKKRFLAFEQWCMHWEFLCAELTQSEWRKVFDELWDLMYRSFFHNKRVNCMKTNANRERTTHKRNYILFDLIFTLEYTWDDGNRAAKKTDMEQIQLRMPANVSEKKNWLKQKTNCAQNLLRAIQRISRRWGDYGDVCSVHLRINAFYLLNTRRREKNNETTT